MSTTRAATTPGQWVPRSLEAEVIQPWGLLLVVGLALLMAVLTFAPQLDPEVDSADYIVLGQALRAGRGMRYVHLPDAPPADKLPVGFPLLLAGVEWLAPGSLVAKKALVAACYVGAVALTFRLAATYVAPLPALLVAVLVALNPFVLGMARIVMSELPYLCASLVALCLLERALDPQRPAAWWAWGGGLAALLVAAQIRTIGWSLLLALLIVLLLQRRYRTLGLALAGVGGLVGLLALAGVGPVGSRYLAIWEHRMAPSTGTGADGAILSGIGTSAIRYGLIVIPGALFPVPPRPIALTAYRTLPPIVPAASGAAWTLVPEAVLAGLCLLILALGAWPSLRRQGITPYYMVIFMGLLFLWPPEFSWARMVVPVIPFLFIFGAIGLQRLWTWLPPRVPALDRGLPALVGALLLAQLWGGVSLRLLDQDYFPEWTEFVNTAEWIRTRTDPNDLILADFPAHLYILTGRSVDYLFRKRTDVSVKMFGDFGQLLQHIDHTEAKYLVDDGISLTTEGLKQRLFALAAQPGSRWKITYRGRGNGVYVRSDLPITPETREGAARK